MSVPSRKCRQKGCGAEYVPRPNHPGNILDCPDCAVEHAPAPRGMTFSVNKHTMDSVMVITHDRKMADAFSKSQRRSGGQGVLKGIVERKS